MIGKGDLPTDEQVHGILCGLRKLFKAEVGGQVMLQEVFSSSSLSTTLVLHPGADIPWVVNELEIYLSNNLPDMPAKSLVKPSDVPAIVLNWAIVSENRIRVELAGGMGAHQLHERVSPQEFMTACKNTNLNPNPPGKAGRLIGPFPIMGVMTGDSLERFGCWTQVIAPASVTDPDSRSRLFVTDPVVTMPTLLILGLALDFHVVDLLTSLLTLGCDEGVLDQARTIYNDRGGFVGVKLTFLDAVEAQRLAALSMPRFPGVVLRYNDTGKYKQGDLLHPALKVFPALLRPVLGRPLTFSPNYPSPCMYLLHLSPLRLLSCHGWLQVNLLLTMLWLSSRLVSRLSFSTR